MKLRVATWNINSVRLRSGLVERFLQEQAPDILCLQETKCHDAEFPSSVFKALGYGHLAIHGQKGYHGVAIASKIPLLRITKHDFCGLGDARHVAIELEIKGFNSSQLQIHNLYIPAGGDEPDREINPKFGHKLDFLRELADFSARTDCVGDNSILVGDLNVAPLETDVWNHKALLKIVSHTPVEVEALGKVLQSGRWVDCVRQMVPAENKLYSWWSYRSQNWDLADKGRRLDHVWATPNVSKHVASAEVFREVRGWERPSDHVPTLVTFEFAD